MKPILYKTTEKAFTTNGIGVLSDAVSCYVDTELNGMFELELTCPANGVHVSKIGQRSIILARASPGGLPQPFRVYRVAKPMGSPIKVYARHIAYDLMGIPVSPFIAKSAKDAMQGLYSHAAVDCPFTFWTDKETVADMDVTAPKAAWSLLGGSEGSILDVYGGEYEFDRFAVRLHKRLGEDRGVSIRYGKNLTSLEQDENCANVYTGVYPFWKGTDGALVSLPEKIIPAEGTFDHVRILTLDLSSDFEEAPTHEQLRTRAKAYMRDNEIGVPKISWTVGFVALAQTEEYKDKALLEEICLGDSVTVIFPRMGINVKSRAVKTRYNVLLDRFESVSLGRVKANISDTIAGNTAATAANAEKIYIESTQRKDDIKKVKAELTVQSDRIEAEVTERRSDIERMEANLAIQSQEISAKVSQTGGTPGSFEWSLLYNGFSMKANGADVFKVDNTGLEVLGKITAWEGKIGCLDVGRNYLSSNGMTWAGDQSSGFYHGSEGFKVGAGFKVDIYGNVYAQNGTFAGNIYAKNIQYGGDYGTLHGDGITSRSIGGGRIAYSTISTSNTNSGINTSLGYADYANDIFNGYSYAPIIGAQKMHLGNYDMGWTTINYVDHAGEKRSLRVMTGQ